MNIKLTNDEETKEKAKEKNNSDRVREMFGFESVLSQTTINNWLESTTFLTFIDADPLRRENTYQTLRVK